AAADAEGVVEATVGVEACQGEILALAGRRRHAADDDLRPDQQHRRGDVVAAEVDDAFAALAEERVENAADVVAGGGEVEAGAPGGRPTHDRAAGGLHGGGGRLVVAAEVGGAHPAVAEGRVEVAVGVIAGDGKVGLAVDGNGPGDDDLVAVECRHAAGGGV